MFANQQRLTLQWFLEMHGVRNSRESMLSGQLHDDDDDDNENKGINLAFQRQSKVLHVKKDSVCMHHWVSDTLTWRTQVHTRVATEMLIKRQLNTLKKLVEEYELTVDVV